MTEPLDDYLELLEFLRSKLDAESINWLLSSRWGGTDESMLYRMAAYSFSAQIGLMRRMFT